MRHRVSGKKLNRTASHRRALRRNMAASLFEHGAIRTTEAKAKELRRFAERLITIARKGTLHARRQVTQLLQDRRMVEREADGQPTTDKRGAPVMQKQSVIQKLFSEIAPRYEDRPGGYTRIIRLADRRIGDAGVQVILQLVEESPSQAGEAKGESKRKRRASKRRQAAEAAGAPDAQEQLEEKPEEELEEKPEDAPEPEGGEEPTEEPKEEQKEEQK